MNFDEIVVKESPGLCRCCLSEGCYKDLGTEYTWMNDTEVYADMLLECFDISISQHNDGPNGSNRLICEVCITRLRDACNFKKQVLDSEKKFVDMLARGEFQPKMIMYQATPMKAEQLLEEPAADDVEYLEDMDFEDDLPLNQLEPSSSDLTTSTAAKVKGKRGRPKKTTSPVKAEKKPKVAKLEAKPQTSKAVAKGEMPLTPTKKNRLLKRNATIILENTTAIPFKWHRQNYLCFFCHKQFKTASEVKEHKEGHKNSNIKSAVSYLRRDEKVKIDVTETSCKICSESLITIEAIKTHLEKHGKIFAKDIPLGVIPYKLSDETFQCAICSEQFQYFVNLNQHMNKHYGSYICDVCGQSFLSHDRLRSHSFTHRSGFKCNICTETFDTLRLKNQHEATIHSVDKTLKCLYCEETFVNYLQRKMHHVTAHKVKSQQFNCPVCSKTFHISSKMQVHLKAVHLRERNYPCTVCGQKFFSKSHLRNHSIKHFGEKIYKCEVCNKSYARKNTLRDHMKIHSGSKRYSCSECNERFDQISSLKLHVKARHPETKN
ncbi:zinc-finger associated domain (zf-AD) domain-containing protein [Phthorimaea operculella]|nr:zinc-finger associated domain (zf-AD) domain-containing protein [Phthorimaea operculella]